MESRNRLHLTTRSGVVQEVQCTTSNTKSPTQLDAYREGIADLDRAAARSPRPADDDDLADALGFPDLTPSELDAELLRLQRENAALRDQRVDQLLRDQLPPTAEQLVALWRLAARCRQALDVTDAIDLIRKRSMLRFLARHRAQDVADAMPRKREGGAL